MRVSPTQVLPASLYGPLRRRLTPAVAGVSGRRHLALTFDDGPHPEATPRLLDLLEAYGVRATFFLVGERAVLFPDVVRAIAQAGHEVAVHGWTHRCVALIEPQRLVDELRRTKQLLSEQSGAALEWYRPPYGIATVSSARAARALALHTVLWSAWGRDWSRRATPASVVATVERTARPGGTVLLHDCDSYGTTGSWRTTLAATETLLRTWRERDVRVGPLADHGLSRAAAPAPRSGRRD